MTDVPDFQRPPVADWMSPPKSSNLPAWKPYHLDLDDGGSSAGWSTPPRSRKTNSQCDEHFSLHLSPDVSITLHSPKSVNAYVTSKNDESGKKFRLKIVSPKHRRRKESPKAGSEEELSDFVPDTPSAYVPDEVPNCHVKTVQRAVLKEFVPPNHLSGREVKSARQKFVKRLQIPDFQPPICLTKKKKSETLAKAQGKNQLPCSGGTSPAETRKRQIDVKSARDYIRAQRKKRMKIVQAEKLGKKIDVEERKKKLEELRLVTLQLAAACAKKQAKNTTCSEIKTVENEDDLTLSLGLRQVRPKRSFNQALASLGKPVEAVLPPQPEEIIEQDSFKENDAPKRTIAVPFKARQEIRQLSARLTRPKKDASEIVIKLAEVLQKKLDEKSNRRKMKSIENIEPKRIKTVAVDVEDVACLTNEIKEIASGFQALQTAIAQDEQRHPDWLFTIEPHPYNIFTAVQNKLRAAGKFNEKTVEDHLAVSRPRTQSVSAKSENSDSGTSELSSSILDSQKSVEEKSISEKISLSSYKANIVLMPTDVKLNNTVKSDDYGKRSESISGQVIDNLSGTEKEEKIKNFTRPDPFQALLDSEFHVLDNLQQNLARVVENQRIKTVNKTSVNSSPHFNNRSVQTSITSEANSIKTEMEFEQESIHTDISQSVKDSASTGTGLSLKMLTRMIKDEEIRSEHQMALIQLRQHALVEKTKACLTELEEKKRLIKDKHSDGPMSAIKKKQRGVLLRYQSEQQEIERLKRMHQIASEERRNLIQEQKEIHQMQLSTKDIMVTLNQKDANTQSSASETCEESRDSSADSINTFIHHSNASENVSEDEILTHQSILRERIKQDAEKLDKCKKFLGEKEQTLKQQKHFVEEILEWERRLDIEETRIKEMKKLALRAAKPSAAFLRDRSTSPVKLTESESKTSASIPEALSAVSEAEEIPEEISKPTARSYASESFESSSDVQKSIPVAKTLPIVKPVLSPRHGARRRYSSGSDDSANLSHTETTSEPSDVECRLKALEEQLKCRKMEADRLRREHKRKQHERLKEKEESLKKQIKAYDDYIEKLKKEVEQETRKASPVIKPVIKQPKAEKIQIEEKSSDSIVEEVEEKPLSESIVVAVEKASSESIIEEVEEKTPSESAAEDVEEKISLGSVVKDVEEKLSSGTVVEDVEEKTSSGTVVEDTEEKTSSGTVVEDTEKKTSSGTVVEDVEEKPSSGSVVEDVEENLSSVVNDNTIASASQIDSQIVDSSQDKNATDEEEYSRVSSKKSTDIIETVQNDSYETDSFESDDETGKLSIRKKNVDGIVNALIDEVLGECVNIVSEIVTKRKHRTVEAVTDFLAGKILDDALNEVLQIYAEKLKRNEEDIENEVTWDVRRRIHEIMGGQMSRKSRDCDQSTLQTTYDVSPTNSPTHDETDGISQQQQFISSLIRDQPKEVHVAHDSDGQEWFDEDFGLTKSRREAEALRLQQLQIEQEIEELQAQQEQVPYFYLREIPNKPPPPYTPPVKPTTASVPTSETEISRQMRLFARNAFKTLQGCKDSSLLSKIDLSNDFIRCLWDLAQELVSEACLSVAEETEDICPWKRCPLPLAKWRQSRRSLPEDAVVDQVVERSLMLFGFRPRVEQETLIVRWSRKKRDHVDELLVWDSQAEEAEWTWYDQDVVQVKNEVADQLMESLLEDTASVFKEIFQKKANTSC